jgi:predicted nucleotidyltransferase component of viral defense system
MSKGKPTNLPASVLQRLLTVSKGLHEDFTLTLARYAVERLLYRLSRSPFAHRFVLKGAMLMNAWAKQPFRRTRDLDLLGYGEPSVAHLQEVFAELCALQVEPDGLTFDPTTIRIEAIRDDQEYQGQRVRVTARLGNTRIVVQADIGFGDAVTPPPEKIEYPTILKMPAPRLRAYPREAVIAEKLHAMVVLGVRNSRMKDFFDLALIARTFRVAGERLAEAIQATFARRLTSIPTEVPFALSKSFFSDPVKRRQWEAFFRKSGIGSAAEPFEHVVPAIRDFLLPPMQALVRKESFPEMWPPGGPWRRNARVG